MPRIFLSAIAMWTLASVGYAHPGHIGANSFAAGFSHPFAGADHLLTMIAVGLWARFVTPRYWQAWPATFVFFMVAGFFYGAGGGALAGSELLIALSLLVFGGAIALRVRPALWLGAAVVGLFATAHGYAHGVERTPNADVVAFAEGFAFATAVLHCVGVAAAEVLMRVKVTNLQDFALVRLAGVGIAIGGLTAAVA